VALLPPERRIGLGPGWPWAAGGVALLVLFGLHERRTPEPIVPFALLRDPLQAAANAAGFLLGICMFAQLTFLPLYIERVLGGGPIDAGRALIPVSVGWTLASFGGGRVIVQYGYRPAVRAGALAAVAGCVGLALRIGLDVPALLMPSLAMFGLGMGACVTTFVVGVQDRVEHARRGAATALTVFSRSMGGAVGTSLLGAGLAFALRAHPAALARGVAGVFWAAAGASVAAAALVWAIFPRAVVGSVAPAAEPAASPVPAPAGSPVARP